MPGINTTVGLIKALAPKPTQEQVTTAVDDWLDDHPEATTTVQDGAISYAKLDSEMKTKVETIDDLEDETNDLKSAINDTDDVMLGFFGTLSRTNVAVSKGSTRKELLTFDLTFGNGITIDIKLHSALSVNTYLYLQTENGTDLFPGTSRSISSGSTTFTYSYTPSADNKNCKLQYTIASSATTDALFDYVKITAQNSTYAADLANVYTTMIDSDAQNSYISQPKTGIVSISNAIVKKNTTQAVLLHCDLQRGNPITVKIKLKSALSINTYMYLQDANGTNLLPNTSYSLSSGNTEYMFTFTPSQDYTNCSLKYTIANSATTDAEFEYVYIDGETVEMMGIKEKISGITGDVIVPFEIGNITINSSGWTYGTNTKRIRTPQGKTVHLYIGDILTIENGAEFYIGALKQDETYYDGGTWKTGTFTIDVEGDYVFVGRYNPEVVIDDVSALAAKLTVFTNASMQGDVNMLKSGYGTGNVEYTGGRITITNNPIEKHRCSIELWKNFTNVSQYNLYLNQSITIYNGFVFAFNQNGSGCVLDYSTKDIISTFTLPVTANQHSNSAQFMDIYYNANDDYPLLLISRCGNADYSSGTHDLDEAQIYRVQESNGVFTFTLINTIRFSKQTYGISWGVDNVNKKLYATATVNGNWSVRENNPKYYWVFELPNATSILSETEIVLAESDALETMRIDFAIGQGLFVNGGVVYEGIQDVSGSSAVASLWAIAPSKNRIVSKVPLAINLEPEGVAIYNGKVYISQKVGTDTTGTNPMRIYEIDFS